MIQMQFENVNYLWEVLDQKVSGIKELTSIQSRNEIAKAVFTVTYKKFLKDFSLEAKSKPDRYHHMFEWGAVGNNNQKLFKITRGRLGGGNLEVNFKYLKSSKNVPVPAPLLRANRRGKKVTRRSIFANKAEFIESGQPARFVTKRTIVFLSEGKTGRKIFRPRGTSMIIQSPGGREAAGSFERYIDRWHSRSAYAAMRPLFKDLGREVAKSLNKRNGGPVQARQAIKRVSQAYSGEVTEL